MTWILDRPEPRKFERNPLEAVICELRFHPILRVDERISDFQEEVRATFPVYEAGEGREVALEPGGNVNVRSLSQHQFKTEDGASLIVLKHKALAIECRQHSDHKTFMELVRVALSAFERTVGSATPTRLGLRYINAISKKAIENNAGRALTWNDIVQPEFIGLPNGLVDLENTHFMNQINSPIDNGGMTVRYGIEKSEDGSKFRLDMDRYSEGSFDLATTEDLLERFHEHIHRLFLSAVGSELEKWMRPLEQ